MDDNIGLLLKTKTATPALRRSPGTKEAGFPYPGLLQGKTDSKGPGKVILFICFARAIGNKGCYRNIVV